MITSPVTQLLEQHHIDFEVITIPLTDDNKPIRHLEALLTEQGRDANSVIKSLLFKTNNDDFILLAATGLGRADWATLRKHLNVRKLRMAEPSEIESATHYVMGAVPPIALPETITTLVDNSIEQFETVIIGSGVLGYALSLSSSALLSLLTHAEQQAFLKI